MPRSSNAIPALDGLRAIAILMVIARHGVNPFWSETDGLFPVFGWDAGIPLTNGWMGVDLFFVLSGFLVAHQILNRHGNGFSRADVRGYFYGRAMRIAPAYLAAIAIAVSGIIPAFSVDPAGLGSRVGYHLLFLQDYVSADIVVAFWSLGVEVKFYVLAPFVLMGVQALRSRGQQYGVLVLLASIPLMLRLGTALNNTGDHDLGEFFTAFRSPFHVAFDGLAIGVLAAFIYRDRDELEWAKQPRTVNCLFWAGAAPYLVLALGGPQLDSIGLFDKVVLQAALAWTGGAMLLALALGGGPQQLLTKSWMFVVSKLSYSWYLLHLVFVPMSHRIADALVDPDTTGRGIRWALFTPIYVTTSLGGALVLHYAVEKPFMELRDRRRNRAVEPVEPAASVPVSAKAGLARVRS